MNNNNPIIDEEFESSLTSFLASDLIDFVRRKKAAGVIYENDLRYLRTFDAFVSAGNDKYTTTDKVLAEDWADYLKSSGIHVNTVIRKSVAVMAFFRYRYDIGKSNYLFEFSLLGRSIRYRPHFITDEELISFFKIADILPYSASSPLRHLTAPVVFRLMYSSGIRVSEIKNITYDDVDLNCGIILIRESKDRGLRITALHADMVKVLKFYDSQIKKHLPHRQWFFIDRLRSNRQLSNCCIGRWFASIRNRMPEIEKSASPTMTARDFRHRHALDVIAMWHREGKDINALAPYLVCSMGHARFEMTSYYLSVSPEKFADIEKSMVQINGLIMPDFESDDGGEIYG